MAIDILPTVAHLTGSKLPEKEIDGKNIWNVLASKTTDSPHEAYFFYYKVNELHGVRYKDWKMYYPRAYKSLNNRPGGKNGLPVDYDINTTKEKQLFNLSTDIGENNNVVLEYPKVVQTIDSLANIMRIELGDSFQNIVGKENRPVGKIEF